MRFEVLGALDDAGRVDDRREGLCRQVSVALLFQGSQAILDGLILGKFLLRVVVDGEEFLQ